MLRIEKRRTPDPLSVILVSVVAILLSLTICIVVLQLTGYDAFSIILQSFQNTYLTKAGNLNLLVYVPSISLCALAVVVAAKAGLWNVGVEGQFLMGALVAAGLGFSFPNLPWYVMIVIVFAASAIAAGALCYLAVVPRIYFGINEILTTVLFNSIMSYMVGYVSNIAWRDTTSSSPQTLLINDNAVISRMPNAGRLHWGFIVAVLLVLFVWLCLRRSVTGFEMRAVGESQPGARYTGINLKKIFFIAMFASGCLAGIAGMLEVSGVSHRLQPKIASDYGLSGFVIAWISRLNPIVILIVSYLFAGFTVVGFKLQMAGFQSSIVSIMKGLILFFILAGEIFTFYKISWVSKKKMDTEEESNGKGSITFVQMLQELFLRQPNSKEQKKEESEHGRD